MQFRRAQPSDYSALAAIAAENTGGSREAKAGGGFLTGHFTPEYFASANADLAVIVADDHGTLAGFLSTTTREAGDHRPILQAMLTACGQFTLDHRRLSDWKLFIYGPVCVAAGYRGQGLLKKLFMELKRELAGRYEVGVAFVDRENPHSLRAHVQGLGMTQAGEFEFQERRYYLLAFRL